MEGVVTNKKWRVKSFGKEYELNKINSNYGATDAITNDGHFMWGDYGVAELDLSEKDTNRPPAYITGMNIMDQPADFWGRSHSVLNGMAWR